MPEPDDDRTQTYVPLTKGTMVSHYRIIERLRRIHFPGAAGCRMHATSRRLNTLLQRKLVMLRQRCLLLAGLVTFIIASPVPSMCQDTRRISVDWVYSEEVEDMLSVPPHRWLDDNRLVLLDTRVEKAKRTVEVVDPESGKREPILDMAAALASLRSLTEKMDTLKVLPWPDSWHGLAEFAVYLFDDDIFMLDFSSATFRRLTSTKAAEKCARVSPDGRYIGFVRDNDLYVYDVVRGKERRLTTGGSETTLNGTLSWLYWEEIFGRVDQGYWWSSDSKSISFLHTEQASVDTMYHVAFEGFSPSVTRQFFPRAGGVNPSVTLGIVSPEGGKIVWMDLPSRSYEYILAVTWCPDGKRLAVETLNRAQTELNLYLVNRSNGVARHLLKESNSAWVNAYEPYFLANSDRFLWLSDRDGFNHLYLYGLNGAAEGRVTQGDWAVLPGASLLQGAPGHSLAVDESQGWVYFIATETSPVERHLYRANLDGSTLENLSPEPGTETASFSPNLRYYLNQHSSLTSPPVVSLHRSDGSLTLTLEAPTPLDLSQFNVQYPALTTVMSPDGVPLPCMITKPQSFDPARRYPVIFGVYGGPAAPVVTNSWRGESTLLDQLLLDQGFVLVSCDNRSAATVNRALSNSIKGELWGHVELADLMTVVSWLKDQPWVDSSRLGIRGWSGGGTYTLLAMTHTTVFKAGVAGAPATDWRYYDTKYTEEYMGRPEENPHGYDAESLVAAAADLHGRLLLIHGTGDDNVHIQHSWAFIDELVKAGHTLDMMIYPSRKHDFDDKAAKIHREKTIIEFWMRNL